MLLCQKEKKRKEKKRKGKENTREMGLFCYASFCFHLVLLLYWLFLCSLYRVILQLLLKFGVTYDSGPVLGNMKHIWGDCTDRIFSILGLPWTHFVEGTQPRQSQRIKCLSIQILSKIGPKSESELEVLDLGLSDEVEEVRLEAVISMPLLILSSGFHALLPVFTRLK